MTRPWVRLIVVAALLVVLTPIPAPAAEEAPAEVDAAISRGLAFLAKRQRPDGLFAADGPRLATGGLALLAFLSNGHTPDIGLYGGVVRKTVDALVAAIPPDGYIGKVDGGRMYGQGIVALALAEAYGVEPDPARREAILAATRRLLGVILSAQSIPKDAAHAGGWRYDPTSADSDLSLSGWNALALGAARDIGLDIPADAAGRAADFIRRCHRPDPGGYAYQPGQQPSAAMTGVAIVCLHLLDPRADAKLPDAGKLPDALAVGPDSRFAYYGFYYSTHAARLIGGDTWTAVWRRTREGLLPRQRPDGDWPASSTREEPADVYPTAMAILSLSAPTTMLPIHRH